MKRIAEQDADQALTRDQPVAEEDLVWGAGYVTTWDGTNWQVLTRRLDENGQPAVEYDDDGNPWAAFDLDGPATGAAAAAWQEDHPAPGQQRRRAA